MNCCKITLAILTILLYKLFASTKRAEWLEQPSVEELTSASLNASRSDLQVSPLKRKQEATTL